MAKRKRSKRKKKCGPGRPIGGKSHPAVRKYWREAKRRERARKRRKERKL